MTYKAWFQCINPQCGATYPLNAIVYHCEKCQSLLEVQHDTAALARKGAAAWMRLFEDRYKSNEWPYGSGVWGKKEWILPQIDNKNVVSLYEGGTNLFWAERFGKVIGLNDLWIKLCGNTHSGSFKDLGMTACITRADSRHVRRVACASTGNTSSSMAAYAARAGMKALVFVPYRQISAAKLAQALDFGALVVEVGDTFDEAFRLLREIAPELGLYLVNSVNPFRIEGQKTIAAELMEQRAWRPPDYIVVPGGNLGNASAIGKGLRELKGLGFIEKVSRILVIQAAGANPFYRTLEAGSPALVPVGAPDTEATAIRIGHPANWKKAKRVLEWSGGFCESVTDEELFDAKRVLAEDGVGCEPASAATVAGVRKLVRAGKIERHADVVCVLTGNQLKDTEYIMRHRSTAEESRQRLRVKPNVKALREALEVALAVPA